jgi:hypothetical protein
MPLLDLRFSDIPQKLVRLSLHFYYCTTVTQDRGPQQLGSEFFQLENSELREDFSDSRVDISEKVGLFQQKFDFPTEKPDFSDKCWVFPTKVGLF